MLNKDVPNKESYQHSRGAVIGGILGGIIGFVIAFLYKFAILIIPGFATIFAIASIDPIITGIVLGIVIGIIIGILAVLDKTYKANIEPSPKKMSHAADSNVNIHLHEEQLEISKNKIKTGEVSIHKEVSTKEKNITVPVKREELVIEKTVSDSGSLNKSDAHTETIRIPISEERIDINKQPITLEDVSVNTHRYEEIKHITETLKKETPHVTTNGNAKVVNEEVNKK